MKRQDFWWLKDMDAADPDEWIPIARIIREELRFIGSTGIRVRSGCPGKNGGEFRMEGGVFLTYPSDALLNDLFSQNEGE